MIALERQEQAAEADRQYMATGATPQQRIADRLRQAAGEQAQQGRPNAAEEARQPVTTAAPQPA